MFTKQKGFQRHAGSKTFQKIQGKDIKAVIYKQLNKMVKVVPRTNMSKTYSYLL